jgi:hypothetical protein
MAQEGTPGLGDVPEMSTRNPGTTPVVAEGAGYRPAGRRAEVRVSLWTHQPRLRRPAIGTRSFARRRRAIIECASSPTRWGRSRRDQMLVGRRQHDHYFAEDLIIGEIERARLN